MIVDWTEHLNNLEGWATERGYYIDFVRNGDNCICHISKLIEINSSCPKNRQVIYLLHELGHALIFENGSVYNFKDKRKYEKHVVAHKVFTVIEEAEAWRRGRELAKRLKIPIDDMIWEKSMVKALKKYINWASDMKEKNC
jgi:Zn-dependent peptidase ImmA (M78 family)